MVDIHSEPDRAKLLVLAGRSAGEWRELFEREAFSAITPDVSPADKARALEVIDELAAHGQVGVFGTPEYAQLVLDLARECRIAAGVVLMHSEDIYALKGPPVSSPFAVHLAGRSPGSEVVDNLAHFAGAQIFETGATAEALAPNSPHPDTHAQSVMVSRSLSVLRPVLGPKFDYGKLFREHLAQEFRHHDADATMATMIDQPYVNHVPTLTGGYGHDTLKRFYKYHFIPSAARNRDRETILVSETIGSNSVVLELLVRFTHDEEHEYMLPGLAPTGRRVEFPSVVIAKFQGDKLCHEHIYWDQASVLRQIGALDPAGLPISGIEQARKVLDPSLPSNEMMPSWTNSEGKPI